ncbi:MAG: leucyl aminopeptidase family protein [Bacteroides sp.]|nr:leucyl aminopeptidase family protein [Bacteroides sp.]MCM1086379.1 leucyl aminopeptidase family protein [Bacteroides sp.]
MEKEKTALIYLACPQEQAWETFTDAERNYIGEKAADEAAYCVLPYPEYRVVAFYPQKSADDNRRLEDIRRTAAEILCMLRKEKIFRITVDAGAWHKEEDVLAFMESMYLAAYAFDELKAEKSSPFNVSMRVNVSLSEKLHRIQIVCDEVNRCKQMVNLPFTELNAADLAEWARKDAASIGVEVKSWDKAGIEAMGMGGLLGVNRGSVDEPSFTQMEYRPSGAVNKKPIVLVGKGVVFDAGGMNIKTGNYMEDMKTDMAGAALAISIVRSVAQLKLPLHVIGLLPATDNRLNGNALVCGDIIRMYDGSTVEITNTDAEGRLLLADAVAYAQKNLDPALIVSMATLTGAASRALGSEGIAAMQERADRFVPCLLEAGDYTHERLCFFPMWKEYEKELESEVADLKNCGKGAAGMVTAAKFVGHFTDAPFLHLDVAGVEFLHKRDAYRGPGATGFGIRMMMRFLETCSLFGK